MVKKIEIIVPVHNGELFLETQLKSLLNQTYPKDKIKIYVYDDFSTDGSRDIIQEYVKKNPHQVFLLISLP